MAAGDIIILSYGCSTLIVLRREGRHGDLRAVGQVYIHFMGS